MQDKRQKTGLSRREFFKFLGAAGVSVIGISLADVYQPWVDYDRQTQSSRKINLEGRTMNAKQLELFRYATLAASGHNTQPWQFAADGNHLYIYPDKTRRLPVVDPADRELWISLGCALENLLIAARESGFSADVIYPDSQEFIDIRLAENTAEHSDLFTAIPQRQNTRSVYDGRALKPDEVDRLQAVLLEPGITLRFINGQADLDRAADFIRQGTLVQYTDKEFLKELVQWVRFNKKEALASMDGLYSRCSGNPEVPRFIGRWFVEGTNPQQQAEADIKKLRSSAGAVVIASTAEDRTNWVRTGQVYERLVLTMTALNIKSSFLNQPLEVQTTRLKFQQAFGLGAASPQLLVRFGYAAAMPNSLRRPVDLVLPR